MSAEDYEDVPGIGGSTWTPPYRPKDYACNFCKAPITFNQRRPFNKDGTPHRCKSSNTRGYEQPKEVPQEARLYALAAMNAIINGSIQSGGVDFIHHMNFFDVADAAWQVAAAMASKEKQFHDEYRG